MTASISLDSLVGKPRPMFVAIDPKDGQIYLYDDNTGWKEPGLQSFGSVGNAREFVKRSTIYSIAEDFNRTSGWKNTQG